MIAAGDIMKRIYEMICSVLMIIALVGCGMISMDTTQPTPEPTPNPLEAYSGEWTWEFGDGSIVWTLYDDGRILMPEQSYDGYRSIGGFGSWSITDSGLSMTFAETYPLRIVEEDGFVKLYCPLMNQTLVRTHQREAAYAAKYVDVTLTDENLWEYFRLEQVPSPTDENGQRIYKEVFVFRSTRYDSGLLYWSEEAISLDFTYWWSYQMHMDRAPFGVSVYVDNYNAYSAEGSLTFVRSDHVAEHRYDGKTRTVVLNSGETKTEAFDSFRYGNYPY